MPVKRQLIAETLVFYTQMGTPAAVNRIIRTIFETGYISEWWEYGGKPHHFKAHTTNPHITQANVEEFRRALSSVNAFRRGWTKSCWSCQRIPCRSIWAAGCTRRTLSP